MCLVYFKSLGYDGIMVVGSCELGFFLQLHIEKKNNSACFPDQKENKKYSLIHIIKNRGFIWKIKASWDHWAVVWRSCVQGLLWKYIPINLSVTDALSSFLSLELWFTWKQPGDLCDHKTVWAWRDFKDHLIPTPCHAWSYWHFFSQPQQGDELLMIQIITLKNCMAQITDVALATSVPPLCHWLGVSCYIKFINKEFKRSSFHPFYCRIGTALFTCLDA